MSGNLVFLISRTNGFNIRLAVALFTLRKVESDIAVTILHSRQDVEIDQLYSIAKTFNASLKCIGATPYRRRKSLLLKTQVHQWTDDSGPVIYCDADIHFEASPRPLLELAVLHGFVVTKMCNWSISTPKIAGRIKPWIEASLFEQPAPDYAAVNSGVFAWDKGVDTNVKNIWLHWEEKTARGIELFGGGHCIDEYPLNLLAIQYGACFVGSEWNAYGKYHPNFVDIKIYHHAGSKHFRENWWDGVKSKIPSSARWCMFYDQFRSEHPKLAASITHDRHTLKYLELTGRKNG